MRTTFFRLPGILMTLTLMLSACNLTLGGTPVALTPLAVEVTAESVIVDLAATQTKPVEIIPTDTPSATPTETLTPEPSATATPEAPMAEVRRESNCRTGPGEVYKLVAKYQVGQMLSIIARDLGGGYWYVQNPDKPEEQCYLLAQNIRITGETTVLPQFTPPPSPTAAPYFEVSFKKFDTCDASDYAVFTVENIGSVAFRSAYIKVINQKANKSVEQSLNAFDLRVKCVLAKNIAPLNPGEIGYVSSSPFKWTGHGSKLRAIIMACTEQNLKGICVTQTVDIKE